MQPKIKGHYNQIIENVNEIEENYNKIIQNAT